MNHICLIKDINKYLYRNNKHQNKKITLCKMPKFI